MPQANATSNMFEPKVFLSMVQALEPDRGLYLYNSVRKDTTIYPYAEWTEKRGAFSELAEYNVPNSKANLVDRGPSGETVKTAALAYIREGDRFTPTATKYIKDINAGNDAALVPAEKIIADQVKYVNDRVNNRIEWSLWQAIQGGFTYTGPATGTFTVDYNFRPAHKVTLGTSDQWTGTPTTKSLIGSIRTMKQMIRKDGGVDVNEVILTSATMDLLLAAWRNAVIDGPRPLTDEQINLYYATGELKGFMGIETWKTIDQYYDVRNADGQTVEVKPYLDHGTVVFMNRSANNALSYVTGPTADYDAPNGHIGRFGKNWLDKDPSGYSFLVEEYGLPVIDRPDQFGTLKVASSTWVNDQTWRN